jgi:2,4-dienoyl-CoA reductase-like NADH-dependent reductase (Old Yellow Enzyme family)
MSAHGMGLGYGSRGISDQLHTYLVARARGGAAMIGTESAPVHPSTVSRSLGIRLYEDDVIPSLARTAEAIHEAGSRMEITLWHGGHTDSFIRAGHSLAPSPIPNKLGEVPKAISRAEIRELVSAYGAAARRCRLAGLDSVLLQTATNYLLGSFLSPTLNHRTDEYGGCFENRTRIVREVLEQVREAAGDRMAVGIRTSVRHQIAGAANDYDVEESLACMKSFTEAGLVDYVSLMSGSDWAPSEQIPIMASPRVHLGREGTAFKQALAVPVFIAGRIREPEEVEQIIVDGVADVVAMARTWIAEPDWLRKIRDGSVAQLRPCTSCNQSCVSFVFRGLPASCMLNPSAGRELELPDPKPAVKPKRIAVIGGGPAGMEASRVLALRGHRVSLHEEQPHLGGQMRLAALAPHRGEMRPALDWWEQELRRLQVNIQLGRRVSPEGAATLSVDAVVWAIGAEPGRTAIWRLRPYLRDGIPGTDPLPSGRDVLAGRVEVAGRVLVIEEEGGWPAVSLVDTLVSAKKVETVTVTTPERSLAEAELSLTWELASVTERMRAAGVRVLATTMVDAVSDGKARTSDGETLGPFDHIVMSTGTAARQVPEGSLAIGDCVAPRGIWAATSDAAHLARRL